MYLRQLDLFTHETSDQIGAAHLAPNKQDQREDLRTRINYPLQLFLWDDDRVAGIMADDIQAQIEQEEHQARARHRERTEHREFNY